MGSFPVVSIFYVSLLVFTLRHIFENLLFHSAYQTRSLSCETIGENWNDKDNTSKIF